MSNFASEKLSTITADYLRAYCEAHPTQAVWLGFHTFDGRLPDHHQAALEARAADLRRFLAALNGIDTTGLDDLAWLDHQVTRHHAAFELFVLEDWQQWRRDPLFYLGPLDASQYVLRDYAPLEQRVRALIAHLTRVPSALEPMQDNLTQVSRPVLNIAIRLAQGMVSFLEEDLGQAVGGLEDETLQAEFEAALEEAIHGMERIVTWLEEGLAPRAGAEFAIGADHFARMLSTGEAVEVDLERLAEIAEADLRRNKSAYLEIVRQIAPGREVREVIAEGLRNHPQPENLIAETREMVDELRRAIIERELVSVPYDENCIVDETPPFLRFAFAMMDPPGPFEQVAREAYYYVTPPEPEWSEEKTEEWMSQFAYPILRGICVHEAWPGHYLHFLHLRNAPSDVTKAFGAYSSYEAWAHYCEQMMLEVGWRADDPWARLGQLSEALVRNVRFVCALGLHTQGMTVEEAKQRFIEDAFMEPATAQEEAQRGTGDPQYLNYTLGKLMLLKLRADVQAREGEDFDLRTFHDRFLSYGAPPVPLVRALMLGRDEEGEVV